MRCERDSGLAKGQSLGAQGCLLPKHKGCVLPKLKACVLPKLKGCVLQNLKGCALPKLKGRVLQKLSGSLSPREWGARRALLDLGGAAELHLPRLSLRYLRDMDFRSALL